MNAALQQHYGYLFEPELLKEIDRVGVRKSLKQGEKIMDIGQSITSMPLLFDGAIKVLREDDDGDELLLYFLEKGDTCAMTFTCCLGTGTSEVRAIAETDIEMLMIPIACMDKWMATYQSWRKFVIESYHERMTELMETVDSIAFMRMDDRLMKYLKDKAMVTHDDVIHATHQEVAQDLHTSRVVISRLLKKLERDGKIELHRNAIRIIAI